VSQQYKSVLYKQLRDAGVPITKHYREWSVDELTATLTSHGLVPVPDTAPDAQEGPSGASSAEVEESPPAAYFGYEDPSAAPATKLEETTVVMSSQPNPDELPGQRLNTNTLDDVIRVDEHGRKWHQEEVRKPAYPKPRGRRVLKYMDTGVRKETVQQGEYVETFEVAGNEASRPAEVKITLPSYQVGIYTDPRFPFKIHCYDGREGFDLAEVQNYYGGSHLVPDSCKRVYIENELCYDIRTVIRTIQAEHRHLQLTGKIQ
jgi:hypothetical protein